MNSVEQVRRSENLTKVLSENSQAQAFTPPALTNTGPDKNNGVITPGFSGVWDAGGGTVLASRGVLFQPYAVGWPGQQFLMQVFGYRHFIVGNDPNKSLWVPQFFVELQCTLSNINGIQDSLGLGANEYMCDQIALTQGLLGPPAETIAEIISPGGDLLASVVVDIRGCKKWQAQFSQNGDNVFMNALWAPIS